MQLLVIYVAVVKTSSHNPNRPICPLLPPAAIHGVKRLPAQ